MLIDSFKNLEWNKLTKTLDFIFHYDMTLYQESQDLQYISTQLNVEL